MEKRRYRQTDTNADVKKGMMRRAFNTSRGTRDLKSTGKGLPRPDAHSHSGNMKNARDTKRPQDAQVNVLDN